MTILDDVKKILTDMIYPVTNAVCGIALCGITKCGSIYKTSAICGIALCGNTTCNDTSVVDNSIKPSLLYLSRLPEVQSDCMALTLDGGNISSNTTRLKTSMITFLSRGHNLNKQRANVENAIQLFIESVPVDIGGCRYMSVIPTTSGHFQNKDRAGPLYTESIKFEVIHT